MRIPIGSHYGTNLPFDFSSQGLKRHQKLYFRYYLRFGSNWAPEISGKLPGLSHVNPSTGQGAGCKAVDGNDGWSARMKWSPVSGTTTTNVGFYVYHADMLSTGSPTYTCGDHYNWNDATGYTPLVRNKWSCVEGYMKVNDPGASNGVLKGWINGKPAFTQTGMRFRTVNGWLIDKFWANIYYGGKATAPSTMDIYLDSVVLAEKRIGCDPDPCNPTWKPGAEDELFKDMSPGSFAYKEAMILFANGITNGCRSAPNRMFCPSCSVKRSHMATFIVRSAGWPLVNPATPTFSDVPKTHMFYREIETLKAHKVTYGCGSGKFCPDSHVTRAQMAAFLRRAAGWPTVVPATPSFDDVPASYLFYADIETIYAHGVTKGCGNGNFCPKAKLTRAQAAIFLVRTFNLK